MKLMIVTTVLALTAGTSFADDKAATIFELSKPEINLLDAAAIADKAAGGDLVAVELEYLSENDPVYLADLEGEKEMARLMIDGNSGDILAMETLTAADEEALEAYLENFSTQAELAEMAELAAIIDLELGDEYLSPEDIMELAEVLGELGGDE